MGPVSSFHAERGSNKRQKTRKLQPFRFDLLWWRNKTGKDEKDEKTKKMTRSVEFRWTCKKGMNKVLECKWRDDA